MHGERSAEMARNRMRERQRAATVVTSAIESALANTSLFSLCSARELRLIARRKHKRRGRDGCGKNRRFSTGFSRHRVTPYSKSAARSYPR